MLTSVKHELQRTSPEQQGIPSSAVLRFVEGLESRVHESHSFMLLRHGYVVAEGWWSPYGPEYPHVMFSLSKSFTSTAVGLAVAEGRFSLDDPVLSFFPEETPAEMNDFWAAMQVRHLLYMSTGHATDTWAFMVGRPDGNWIKGFLDTPIRHAPGTFFLYNTGATYMLAAIVQKTTGMKLVEYLEPRLFEPLGIENATWEESPQGIALGGIGLNIKTEDIARFGQLYLQKGMWQGKRLLSEAWVEEATAFHISNGNDAESDWAQGYGYQFWRCRHNAYRGDGAFGQFCIVLPEQDVVLAMTGGHDLFDMQLPMNVLWEALFPAMGTEPLAEDSTSQQRLTEKLSSLSRAPVQGKATSPIASKVSGKTYSVDPNVLNIDTITLNFAESSCTVTIKTAAIEATIPCGYGVWQRGKVPLLSNDPVAVAASGAWTADDSFTMVVRLYETPFFYTLDFHFVENEMIVETQINVTFESTKALLLTARSMLDS